MKRHLEAQEAETFINTLDLSAVINRLVFIEGWKKRHAIAASKQYRNYLFLRSQYPEEDLPPSKEIDDVWHAHILHTADYAQCCEQLFGRFLHHHPHLSEASNISKLEALFEKTQALYHKTFGDYIYAIRRTPMMKRLRNYFSAGVKVCLSSMASGMRKALF